MPKAINSQTRSVFPAFGSKNVRLYYFLTIFLNGWFILPNWVFYFGRFISIPAIGLIDGLSKLVAVVLEVPSGAISDTFGKKATLIWGNVLFALCSLLLINASTFTALLIGNMVMFAGFAFISGAKEAILYDSLLDIHKEDEYDTVLGKVNTLALVTTIFSIFMGGFLYSISPEMTFWAWFIFNVCAIFVLLRMEEPQSQTAEESISHRQYFTKIADGTKSIFRHSFFDFVLPVLFFAMLIKAYEGVVRQNTGAYFGFNGETFGYLMAAISVPALIISYNFGKIAKKFGAASEYLFIILYVLGFSVVYLTNSLALGIVSFMSVYIAQEIARPYILSLVNKNTTSAHRATALSTVSLFSEIPYTIIVIFFGALLTVENIQYLYLGFMVALVAYLLLRLVRGQRYKINGASSVLKSGVQ